MNPFVIETTCEVCGEKGMTTPRDYGYLWGGCKSWKFGRGIMRHSDPQVCADNLRRQREQEESKKNQGEPCPSI